MSDVAERLAEVMSQWAAGDGPLYKQLSASIMSLAETGALEYGAQMPSERELAGALHLSRNTVKAAYQVLRDEQWLETRQGQAPVLKSESKGEFMMSKSIPDFIAYDEADVVNLAWGGPPIAPIVETMLMTPLEIDPDLRTPGEGLPEMRDQLLAEVLAQQLRDSGVPASPDEFAITNGGLHSLSLLLDALVRPPATVVLEDIVWGDVPDTVNRSRARVACMPMDEQGIIADLAVQTIHAARPELVLTTNFHNPTGVTIAEDTAQAILDAAADVGAIVVDNRCAAELAMASSAPRPLAAYDSRASVVTIGSMSKVFWHGLKIGWIHANRTLATHLQRMRDFYDCGAPPVMQHLVGVLVRDHWEDTVRWRREQIRASMEAGVEQIAASSIPVDISMPPGGAWLWLRTPGYDPEALMRRARREGVMVTPGPLYATRAGADSQAIRVACVGDPDDIREGIDRLALAF